MTRSLIEFNPDPRIERVPIVEGQWCYVIDDALRDPERLVQFASDQRSGFHIVDYNAYPGLLLPTPGEISEKLNTFFVDHLRRLFDARRVLRMHSRLALVTLPREQLRPYQRICHSDTMSPDPLQSLQASVLYLFRDESFGGTSFYVPKLPLQETRQLFNDAAHLPNAEFTRHYDIQPGYLCESNRYFDRVASVPAKWNRLIFYDGDLLHSGDIREPDKMSPDPRIGRLTLNGFFTSRRRAG
jgi:Family of unknown function (DUF6445)